MRSDELFGGTTGSGYDKPFGVIFEVVMLVVIRTELST